MPEVEVVIASAEKVKEGTGQYGPWEFWLIKDGNEVKYGTLKKEQIDLAKTLIGQRARITFDEDSKGKKITELAGPLGSEEPKLGTGDYVVGQKAPSDKRQMAASTALKAAVDSLSHTIPTGATAKEAAEKVEPLADHWFMWLTGKAGIQEPDDIPFG